MEIYQLVGIGIVATSLILIIRDLRPEFTIFISLVTGIIIFVALIPNLIYVLDVMRDLSQKVEIEIVYFSTILKIIGIAYIVEFGSQICRDAGENSIAMKIEMAGKLSILVLSIPILLGLMELIMKILP